MEVWLKAQIAAGFPAFAGARFSGSIPLSEKLLNELLQEWLKNPAGGGAAPSGMDLGQWAKRVSLAKIEVTPGVLTVQFEVKL
jgi:hypothetical protein